MIGPELPPPPRRNRALVPAIVIAVLVLVGAGVGIWWFAAGPGHVVNPRAVAATSVPPAPPSHVPVRPSSPVVSATPDTASAYDVGTCFDEQAGSGPGKVELNPVTCGGTEAVFVINKIVSTATDCDADASVNYGQHGYEVPDETANVTYCASLVVPVNDCFTLGGSVPITTVPCGAGPNVVQVLAIEPAPNVGSACTDKTDPDVWFYQSPTSGQYACVSRPATTAPPPPPTTTSVS